MAIRAQRSKREAARAEQERKIAEREAEEAANGHNKRGRKPATPEEVEKEAKESKVNTTDPDSGIMNTQAGFVQGYNAKAFQSQFYDGLQKVFFYSLGASGLS